MNIQDVIMVVGSIVGILKGITSSLKDIHDMKKPNNKKRPSQPSPKRKKGRK